eukprot:1122183-Prymnesium_polylepis.3
MRPRWGGLKAVCGADAERQQRRSRPRSHWLPAIELVGSTSWRSPAVNTLRETDGAVKGTV